MTDGDFDALRDFLAAYFNEDWDMDNVDPDGIIIRFIEDNPGELEIKKIINQINGYLMDNFCVDDKALEKSLHYDLGCYYMPSGDGITPRQWLKHLSDVLKNESLT